MSHNICPKCEGDIALSWLLYSANWTQYRCVNCGALIQWASRRKYVGGFVGGSSAISAMLLQPYIPSLSLRFFIVIIVAFIIMLVVPKQFELVDDHEL